MRAAEARDALPGATAGAAPVVLSRRDLLPFLVFAAACYLVSPWLGFSSRTIDPRITELWPPGGVGFVLLTTVWSAGRTTRAVTSAAMVVVFAATALTFHVSLAASLWMGLMALTQSTLMVWLYRRSLSHAGWATQTPRDVMVLLGATGASTVAVALLGGFPMEGVGGLWSPVLGWWVVRNSVFCFVGAVTFMSIFYARRSEILAPTGWLNRIGLLVAAVVCVFGTYADPHLPLSWLLMIPAVWGGLTLTVRGTAYFSLTVALSAAAMTYLPQNQFGYEGLVPAATIVDLLVIASTAFSFLLTLMRDQRARAFAELELGRHESEAQRRLLETVFESMNDGVMVVEDRVVTKYNSAARQLLGRPIPTGREYSWAAAYGVTSTDGRAIDDEELRAALTPGADEPQGSRVEVVVHGGSEARVVDVAAVPLGDRGQGDRLVMLHDVTAQRARLRELTNFAGSVAHDLRGPLTVLDGWLEVLEESIATDRVPDLSTVARARDASRRMGRVIEDWLGYTVVQKGQLRPEPVRLSDVVGDVVHGRAGEDATAFHLDVRHSVNADPGLLRQLVDNLVGNAVKYTADGEAPEVWITSTHDLEPGWVRIEVADRGVGIPEGDEEHIFEEFHRGPVEGRSAGTGLGLAMTRRIVARHGGELTARRNPEGGSTFSLTLPEAA